MRAGKPDGGKQMSVKTTNAMLLLTETVLVCLWFHDLHLVVVFVSHSKHSINIILGGNIMVHGLNRYGINGQDGPLFAALAVAVAAIAAVTASILDGRSPAPSFNTRTSPEENFKRASKTACSQSK